MHENTSKDHLLHITIKKNTLTLDNCLTTQITETHTLTQLTDEEGAQRGFLMVILNVYIDNMHWLQSLLFS